MIQLIFYAAAPCQINDQEGGVKILSSAEGP